MSGVPIKCLPGSFRVELEGLACGPENAYQQGPIPFIQFKKNATGAVGSLFEKMLHYFRFRREEFLNHYHQRFNAETTMMMIKTKHRDGLRSKTETAGRNEVLCKILCHNLCCLIQSQFELGLAPEFWTQKSDDFPPEPTQSPVAE